MDNAGNMSPEAEYAKGVLSDALDIKDQRKVVFSIFFGRLAGVPSDGIPYPVFAFCGLLPWQLFSYALTQSSNSLVQDAQVLSKVYFPRLIIPFASVVAGLVDFAIAFIVLIGIMFYYNIVPGWVSRWMNKASRH